MDEIEGSPGADLNLTKVPLLNFPTQKTTNQKLQLQHHSFYEPLHRFLRLLPQNFGYNVVRLPRAAILPMELLGILRDDPQLLVAGRNLQRTRELAKMVTQQVRLLGFGMNYEGAGLATL